MAFRSPALLFRRALTGVALTAVVAFSAGCGDDSTGPGGDTYTLFSIDGVTLPAVDDDGVGNVTTVTSGSVNLSGGKFVARISGTYRFDTDPIENWVSGGNGTYVQSGENVVFTTTHDFEDGVLTPADPPTTDTATRTATTLTVDIEGSTYVFKK